MKGLIARSKSAAYISTLIVLSVALWLPRLNGPIDLRYDAGVYYILGTSLAEGKGYRLLNEPGEIEAIQYPPLLPLFAAMHQRLAGTADPALVGHWLRLSFCGLFVAFIVTVYLLSRRYLTAGYAFLVALLTLLQVHTIWMSELFFAEIPFAFVSMLFLLMFGWREGRFSGWVEGALGALCYLLRSMGIALLAAWVAESLISRRFRESAVRAVLAIVPVLIWYVHVAQVKASPEFVDASYEYQRAGYQFYNVGYMENLAYIDPFIPEMGTVSPGLLVERIARNLISIPMSLGGAVSVNWHREKSDIVLVNVGFSILRVPLWMVQVLLTLLGIIVLCGLALLAIRGERIIPLYVAGSVLIMSLTPWPGQFERYLSPLTPLLALALFVALLAARDRLFTLGTRQWRYIWAGVTTLLVCGIVMLESAGLYGGYQYSHVALYKDNRGRQWEQRLFFYSRAWRLHDEALAWLKTVAKPTEIVATSTPHWLYLQTGLKAVMPPFESEVGKAQALLDSVPVTYLIIDSLEFVDTTRRYGAPLVRACPEQWEPIYSTPGKGSAIYRRVNAAGNQGCQLVRAQAQGKQPS